MDTSIYLRYCQTIADN